MNAFRRFISTVPLWAYLLVIIAIYVNTIYLINRWNYPRSGETIKYENGYYIHDYIKPGSALDMAGIKEGDTLVSINSMPVEEWEASSYQPKVGDTLISGILRNNQEVRMPVIVGSLHSYAPGFFWSIYIIMILFSAGSLYLLYKKPHDRAVLLLFIYFQFFMVTLNAQHQSFTDPVTVSAELAFLLFGSFLGSILIHFHLLFPRPAKILSRFGGIPKMLYVIGALFAIAFLISYTIKLRGYGSSTLSAFDIINRIALWWLTLSFILAMGTAISQYFTIKDTLSRNQLRIVILGAFFSCITPISIALFPDQIMELMYPFPQLLVLSQGIGGMIMICCFLIAIFRYRIWGIEVFFRKALLYLGATLVIILSYLLLLYLVDQLTIRETRITRFVILALSVIIFLVLRDWIQRLIDRLFNREVYDSAKVVSDFEENLAGIYRFDELKSQIARGIDEIFHFSSFVFNLKKNELTYEPAFTIGLDHFKIANEFELTEEFEKMLRKSRAFSPAELEKKPPVLDIANSELIVPLLKEDQPYGFFVCGQKKSEKTYSMQDIRVLTLIAKRVIALFHTANLYQKDLDRQLMLDRERTRISQDMHDDVGASLTRISILSELAKNKTDITGETKEWLGQISDTSRGVMEEMSQIIWALNPKNDTLEGLIAYIRRFAFEYLEPTNLNCTFNLPEVLPYRALSVEVRRNVYLVVREALHNVVKHSGATKVLISMEMNEHGFGIGIKDNGRGFDPGKLEFPGNGLINMKKRMKDIGGKFLVSSAMGEGTTIELVVQKI